jgi:hypothetical protein
MCGYLLLITYFLRDDCYRDTFDKIKKRVAPRKHIISKTGMQIFITMTSTTFYFFSRWMGTFSGFTPSVFMKFLNAASAEVGSESDYKQRKRKV